MTDEEKANEISERRKDKHCVEYHCYRSAMEMAQWKNEQFAQEKQQWIEKALKEHCNCCGYAYMACRRFNYDSLHCRYYVKFKKTMEE